MSWVLQLATDLRVHAVDATLDQWALAPGKNTVSFVERGVTGSTV